MLFEHKYHEIVILGMLRQRPHHGYELKKSIDVALGGRIALNNKALYTTLKQFEAAGAVERQVVQQDGKPNRHVYHLTHRGVDLLQTAVCTFPPELAAQDTEFFTRVAFFDVVPPAERIAILRQRLAYLDGGLAYLAQLQHLAKTAGPPPSAHRVLAFHIAQTHNEQRWITAWIDDLTHAGAAHD